MTLMKVNVAPYNEKETDCIQNLCWMRSGLFAPSSSFYNGIRKAGYMGDSKTLFKLTFGKQQTTVDYTLRNWVWTFSNESNTAVIYCLLSSEGVAWEYNTELSQGKAVAPLCKQIIELLLQTAVTLVKKSKQGS
jgi:hypothetical protein